MESLTSHVKTLGVTGGIGTGKSAVCQILAELGARIFSADEVARRIMTEDQSTRNEIASAFGEESYLPDGSLNRSYLAQHVFGSEERMATINGIVHPRVFEAFQAEKERAEKDKVDVLVHEAALIFESGGDRHLDDVLVVDAPLDTRIHRVMERDHLTREQVMARMKHQLPAEELVRRADYVIENNSSLDALRERTETFYRVYLRG